MQAFGPIIHGIVTNPGFSPGNSSVFVLFLYVGLTAVFLDNHSETCYSVFIRGDDGFGSPELREEMPAGRPVTGARVWDIQIQVEPRTSYRSP